METIIQPDKEALAEKGAEIFSRTAVAAVEARGYFAAAISGGSTPRAMYRLLSNEPFISRVPWSRTHLFWVDERMVPYDHPESNFGRTKTDLLDKIPIPSGHIHPMPVSGEPHTSAVRYESVLSEFFRSRNMNRPVFDSFA